MGAMWHYQESFIAPMERSYRKCPRSTHRACAGPVVFFPAIRAIAAGVVAPPVMQETGALPFRFSVLRANLPAIPLRQTPCCSNAP